MTSWKLFLGMLTCAMTLSLGMPPAAEAASSRASASASKKAKPVRKAKPRKVAVTGSAPAEADTSAADTSEVVAS